jgi:hypothetical protein
VSTLAQGIATENVRYCVLSVNLYTCNWISRRGSTKTQSFKLIYIHIEMNSGAPLSIQTAGYKTQNAKNVLVKTVRIVQAFEVVTPFILGLFVETCYSGFRIK